jgi:hypothetical protein
MQRCSTGSILALPEFAVFDGRVEQHAVLGDNADRLVQTGSGDIPNILTVDQDASLAFLEIVESVQQPEDG